MQRGKRAGGGRETFRRFDCDALTSFCTATLALFAWRPADALGVAPLWRQTWLQALILRHHKPLRKRAFLDAFVERFVRPKAFRATVLINFGGGLLGGLLGHYLGSLPKSIRRKSLGRLGLFYIRI